ncbi:AIR synthase related protein, partial [Ralstonia pseudosolanacearum]|uniref:AIR synthase related protein n=1 Tax=Ralstonia pseudosolanacearum TaxID=1310165 RepID=UPI003D16EE52
MLKPPVPADSAEHLSEFGLIRRYFTRPARHATLGVGDDCALLGPRPGHELAISTDMLVAGRHFFADAEPRALGHKALAVNLSDLAAMGLVVAGLQRGMRQEGDQRGHLRRRF